MSFISKILGNNDEEFKEVRIDSEVLESVIYYSKKAYPNEFLAFFDGEIKNKILYITGLIFVPGETCGTGAVVHTELIPINTKYFGSVHSHPGPSARPSDADLITFSRHGYFHMIVCLPYSLETFRAYDRYGESAEYTVGDYSYLAENNDHYEFFDEDDVLTDDDEFKPGFLDEDDDEFFQTLNDEKRNQYEEYEKRSQMNSIPNNQFSNQVIKIELNPDGSVKRIFREFKE